MRKWVSALAVLAGLAFAGPALADSPADVYSDFAEDGALSCGHSRSALNGVLKDASLYQYGDPLTLIQVRLAIRKQLAGGCRRGIALQRPIGGIDAAEASSGVSGSSTDPKAKAKKKRPRAGSDQSTRQTAPRNVKSGAATGKQSGGMILLAIGLLLLTLGSGGWAARRGFADRE